MNEPKILYKIIAQDSDLKKGYPDKMTTIVGNESGVTYANYDFKNHRYLYTFINDEFNIYDELANKDKIINNLQSKIDKANELLQLLHYKFKDEDTIHNEIEDIQKILKEDK